MPLAGFVHLIIDFYREKKSRDSDARDFHEMGVHESLSEIERKE
jgi:hypothetical protein